MFACAAVRVRNIWRAAVLFGWVETAVTFAIKTGQLLRIMRLHWCVQELLITTGSTQEFVLIIDPVLFVPADWLAIVVPEKLVEGAACWRVLIN